MEEKVFDQISRRLDNVEKDVLISRERIHGVINAQSELEVVHSSMNGTLNSIYHNNENLTKKFKALSNRLSESEEDKEEIKKEIYKIKETTDKMQFFSKNWKWLAGAMVVSALFGFSMQPDAREIISLLGKII